MTILEAINQAIHHLEGVRLPVRDRANGDQIQTALGLLDAVAEELQRMAERVPKQTETNPEEDDLK